MVELRGGIKSAWTDIQNETSHKLVDGIRNRSMEVKYKRKCIKYRMKSYKVNTEFVLFSQPKQLFQGEIEFFPGFERRTSLFLVSSVLFYIII